VYRFSSFVGWDSRVSRILANEKPSFKNPASIAPCFKVEEKKKEKTEAEMVETGWSVSTFQVLIQLYNENPLLWNKILSEYGKKNIIPKTLKPLLALCLPIPRFGHLMSTVSAISPWDLFLHQFIPWGWPQLIQYWLGIRILMLHTHSLLYNVILLTRLRITAIKCWTLQPLIFCFFAFNRQLEIKEKFHLSIRLGSVIFLTTAPYNYKGFELLIRIYSPSVPRNKYF